MEILLFLGIALGFTLIPGPNAMLIITTSLSHGTKRSLQTVAGVSLAIAIHLCIAVLSTQWLATILGSELHWLKWIGFGFITFIIIKAILNYFRDATPPPPSGKISFSRGLAFALTNPKAFIFFAAFLIPFASKSQQFEQHVALLSIIFWLTVALCDCCFAIFATQLKKLLNGNFLSSLGNQCKQIFQRSIMFIAGIFIPTFEKDTD